MADNFRKSVPVASADFDELLSSLTTFLKEQDELTDYDFDGSTMKILLRTLAYNTHMNAFFLNMVSNEGHLSTAERRDRVVLQAKDLGYTPRSTRSAEAQLRLTCTPAPSEETIVVPKFTLFTATDGLNSFRFYTTDSTEIVQDDFGAFVSGPVSIAEGKLMQHRFIVDEEVLERGFTIPNQNVDTRFINVRVIENDISSDPVTYSQAENILFVDSEQRAYWVSELEGALHNLRFGDGNIGFPIKLGYEVLVEYIISSADSANGVGTFTLADEIPSADTVSIEVIDFARGGRQIESIDSIKFNAPLFFAAQLRAVIPNDYRVIITREFQNIDDIKIWGGDEAQPPSYGNVFISIKPRIGSSLSQNEKQTIINDILKKYKIVALTPVVVEPEYLFVKLQIEVFYTGNQTSLTDSGIEAAVKTRVRSYMTETVTKFDSSLNESVLLSTVDASESSIRNSNVDISVKKKFYPVGFGVTQYAFVDFQMPILDGSLRSGRFSYLGNTNCFIRQNATNRNQLDVVRTAPGGNIVTIQTNIGSVNLVTGLVELPSFQIQSIPQIPEYIDQLTGIQYIPFEARQTTKNIDVQFNQMIQVDDRDIIVNQNRR